jgi:hypothetical protein
MKKLNVFNLNVINLDNSLNVNPSELVRKKEATQKEPVPWLWDDGGEMLWDNDERILISR